MNAKAKGTRNEHKTIRLLEGLGYTCTRAAASMGTWDIVAVSKRDIRLIQVKSNRGPGTVERETMRLFECPPTCSKEVWVWVDRQRLPRVEVL